MYKIDILLYRYKLDSLIDSQGYPFAKNIKILTSKGTGCNEQVEI